MQITLRQRDIELALKMYLASQGIALADRAFSVDFTAGRKESGLTATIDIGTADDITDAVVRSVNVPAPDTLKEASNQGTIESSVNKYAAAEELVEGVNKDDLKFASDTAGKSNYDVKPETEEAPVGPVVKFQSTEVVQTTPVAETFFVTQENKPTLVFAEDPPFDVAPVVVAEETKVPAPVAEAKPEEVVRKPINLFG